MIFTFPEDAHWNAERQAVEFGVEIGEYHGVVRVPRRVFQRLLPETPIPERCVEAYYLRRTPLRAVLPNERFAACRWAGMQAGDQEARRRAGMSAGSPHTR